jgi:4-hydroxy-3-polyprenylbenzoate decarboxylase
MLTNAVKPSVSEASTLSTQRLVVAISGAFGVIYGVRTLERLREIGIETHLVMTRAAKIALSHETDLKVADVEALPSVVHLADDVGASISSGSFRTLGMIVAPCSIRSLSEIAYGVTSGLLARAADVVLKERRRLVLLVREAPLHGCHLKTMLAATEMGAIIVPPVPAFYFRPKSLAEVIDQTVGRSRSAHLGIHGRRQILIWPTLSTKARKRRRCDTLALRYAAALRSSCSSAASTASPTAAVDAAGIPRDAKSSVRAPDAIAASTASLSRRASCGIPMEN